jgi:hypothetical protein
MISRPIRLAVLCAAGIAVISLLAWGVFGRSSSSSAGAAAAPITIPSPSSTSSPGSSSPEPVAENGAAQPEPSVNAIPSSSPEPNGFPLGVTKEATEYSKEVYAKLPGVKPPVINTDGRNLGPEAIQALKAPRTPVPYPGTNMSVSQGSATPSPSPQTESQIRQLFQPKVSPSAAAAGN